MYKSSEMSVIAYANGFTLWHYNSPDSIDEILAKNGEYFGCLYTLCAVGDKMIISTKDGYYEAIVSHIEEKVVAIELIVVHSYTQVHETE